MAFGGNIADFFASVKFKVDTKELKKIDTHLNQLSKSFKQVGMEFERTSRKIENSLSRAMKAKNIPSPVKDKPSPSKKSGGFSASGFFERESFIRSMLKLTPRQEKAVKRLARAYEENGKSTAEANARLKELIASRIRDNRQIERSTKKINDLNFAQQRAISSAKQLAGTFVSVFTAVQAVGSVVRVGQNLEAATAGMQAASVDSKDLAKSLAFVDEQSVRLGLDLAQTTKDFVKLKAVSKDMKDEDLKDVFLGVAEAGTVLQLTADDQAGALRARSMAH